MARRRNYIVARSLSNANALNATPVNATPVHTTGNQFSQSVANTLPDYGAPNMQSGGTGLYGSIRPSYEIYPGE
ncbi:hypothetical protein GJ688_09995 [Heliobacillus mobilis]|uniref:Uncharacterized protein n=1 Tax=Heliobacterium mobile TaxID=28064 RepID=A0A6I3SK81_HELMO|nr:hypothetical protein [Heliobacterium mobile]MTV49309.1 hypothetical protein [Heliobacterium mobile]